MVSPAKTIFICQSCGYQAPKWLGKCPECQKWNSFEEEAFAPQVPDEAKNRPEFFSGKPQKLKDIKPDNYIRAKTGIGELDRALGGGVVKGAVILIGGEPGIGKSSLLLQVCGLLAAAKRVLYVSGEEAIAQIKLRSERLGVSADNLYIINDTEVSSIIDHISALKPDVVVIDSIQVLYNKNFSQTAGTITQIKECAGILTVLAKQNNFSMFIVGHVTKDGQLAGPKILEHMVDCVIYFEGEAETHFRILRSIKNRFGAANEIGVFQMTDKGLMEVKNPSLLFLSARSKNIPGSTVAPVIEGTRPILVEVQALMSASSFSMSRQRAIGVDLNRLLLLTAVLEKRVPLNLANYDIFVSIAGGLRIVEPGCDLAICAAIYSSLKNKPANNSTVFIGEVGLGGEIRSVSQVQSRINEAARLGFEKCILPKSGIKEALAGKMELIGIENIKEAIEKAF
ncbi:MAG: DNA repair protein RadA [Candidatus Omnitrophica bacterium]|nr:DNA repair protein RadA [Candidatus Omnitrophota bacterium]